MQFVWVTLALSAVAQAASVTLRETTLQGKDIPMLRQELFAGIPFAQPPVGERRLRPPSLKTDLGGVAAFNATQYGFSCIQTGKGYTPAVVDEDCLTINVLRPAGISSNARLPILTYIYGGGFSGGTSGIYNGSAIVAQSMMRGTPVIYVNFNYRTGPLGFPQGKDAKASGSLNLGIKDQIAALKWIQFNIGAFGGDKTQVTVFGQSAGAISISILMLQPLFKQFVRAAILESGSWSSSLTNPTETREGDWENFVERIPACASQASSCSFKCLQNATLSSEDLFAATAAAYSGSQEQVPFAPVLDGPGGVYHRPGSDVLASGKWSQLPFITGCNKDEGTAFIPFPQFVTADDIDIWLRTNFTNPGQSPPPPPPKGAQSSSAPSDDKISQLKELYPNDPIVGAPFDTGNNTFGFNPTFKRLAAMTTDVSFHAQRRLFQQTAASQGVNSYGYHFTDPQPLPPHLGVTHGQEVKYVYGDCLSKPQASQQLCLNMIDYWLSFATSLTPNDGKGSARPTWPLYNKDSPSIIQLQGANTTSILDNYRQQQIAFINDNSPVFHHR